MWFLLSFLHLLGMWSTKYPLFVYDIEQPNSEKHCWRESEEMEKEQKNENVIGEYVLEIKYRGFDKPQFLADCL